MYLDHKVHLTLISQEVKVPQEGPEMATMITAATEEILSHLVMGAETEADQLDLVVHQDHLAADQTQDVEMAGQTTEIATIPGVLGVLAEVEGARPAPLAQEVVEAEAEAHLLVGVETIEEHPHLVTSTTETNTTWKEIEIKEIGAVLATSLGQYPEEAVAHQMAGIEIP